MDPVTAIANVIGQIFGFFEGNQSRKYERLPDWISPKDFQKNDYTTEIIVGSMLLVLVIVIIGITRAK